jgi:hypothetical protein
VNTSSQQVVRWIAFVSLVVCLTGCATASLEPLCSDADSVFDPALLGVWRSVDGRSGFDHIVAIRGTKNDYLVLRILNDVDSWTARLVELGGARFVDLSPSSLASSPHTLYIPVHIFGRIAVSGDTLTVGLLDPDWVKAEKDKAATILLPTAAVDPVIISASTAKLREFAAANATTQAFSAVTRWKREK